jgi:hypothetical protein
MSILELEEGPRFVQEIHVSHRFSNGAKIACHVRTPGSLLCQGFPAPTSYESKGSYSRHGHEAKDAEHCGHTLVLFAQNS